MRRPPFVAALVAALALSFFSAPRASAADAVFSHADWTQVVSRFVDKRGFVNYRALARDRAQLDAYLAQIEAVGPESKPALFPSRNDRLAYYINAYNALVFQGVLERGPEEDSVWKGLISGYTFFVAYDITVDGKETNLRTLENEYVREGFGDPRIHAALNCASIGCPRLPQEAFEPDRLDAQLDAAIVEFVGEDRNFRIDHKRRTVTLSKIFDWFEDDFLEWEQRQGNPKATLVDYVNRYRKGEKVPAGYDVKFFDYDKRINKQ